MKDKGVGDASSPMKEILLTETFLDSLSQIRGKVVTADDQELNKLIHMCMDQSEAEVTEKVNDDIEVALLGCGLELSVFFIAADRVVGKGPETTVIKKYAFLLAIADDFNFDFDSTKPDGGNNSKFKKLLSISRKAGAAMAVLRMIYRLAKETLE